MAIAAPPIARRLPVAKQSRRIIAGMNDAPAFDAVITLNDHHLEAVAAVRQAVQRMDAAGCVIVYPQGQSITPDTPAWRERRRQVEATATDAPWSPERRSSKPLVNMLARPLCAPLT